jgi:hypothetical protein
MKNTSQRSLLLQAKEEAKEPRSMHEIKTFFCFLFQFICQFRRDFFSLLVRVVPARNHTSWPGQIGEAIGGKKGSSEHAT